MNKWLYALVLIETFVIGWCVGEWIADEIKAQNPVQIESSNCE